MDLSAVSVLHLEKNNRSVYLSVKRVISVKITGTAKFFRLVGDGILGKSGFRCLKERHKKTEMSRCLMIFCSHNSLIFRSV